MLFAAGVLFALLFGFLHALFLLVLKAAYVEVALEHDEHQQSRREQKQPPEGFQLRIEIGEIVEEFEKPQYIAHKGGNAADDERGFVVALCAVWANSGEKYEVEHPAHADNGAHGACDCDFFRQHKNECKHKITP